MEVFRIRGGKRLSGTIPVYGLKNAATPIIAATLLARTPSTLKNIPRIEDVFRMLEIVESMGATVRWTGERTVTITPKVLDPGKIDQEKVKRLRSSILLLGALAGRFDRFSLRQPGGCVIGARPVDSHIDALRKLGVNVTAKEKGFVIESKRKKAGKVVLREMSVTATENAMLVAATLPGTTTIKMAACEPHVVDLGRFLIRMGAKITGLGTHTIEIKGKKMLRGATHAIMPDHNEAATFLVLAVATGSRIKVQHAHEEDLDSVLEKLREFGADFKVEKDSITVIPAKELMAPEKVETRTYPGIPTDNQSVFGVLATQAKGDTLIFETLYEGRFNYIPALQKMGAKATVLNPHQARFSGPTKLNGTLIKSYDLRAGASLIIAALIANGETIIEDIYQVDRGYEAIEKRLAELGADIVRMDH